MKSCISDGGIPSSFVPECCVDSKRYPEGIALFNNGSFFEAHEVLEDVWRPAPEPERKFLQGLIQVAVAFHHHSTGNLVGARSLLARAAKNLSGYPEGFGGIQLSEFLRSITHWQRALAEGTLPPPFPQCRWSALKNT